MTFSCETYPRHDSSVWSSSCILLGFLITPHWHVLWYSSRFCRLHPCPPYLPLPMPPTRRQGRQAVKEPRKMRERIGQGLREKPCAAKMADRPCQEGAGLAGKAQLCQDALRGSSTGQTREKEYVNRSDLLQPELQTIRCLRGGFNALSNPNFRGWALKSLTSDGARSSCGAGQTRR